ncbi:MAG: lytic transglycosylase domain-containing protein [Pseudomonadota bacterium]|nr:lytic transglycosylase domain-containing protein [Pseudomonadota bacterium]
MALTCIKMKQLLCAAALAASAALSAHATTTTSVAAAEADLIAMKDAVQKGNWKTLEQLRPRLAGHALEAYPTYWLLVGQPGRADPAEVRAFLKRHADSPLADSLRREWLKSLAAAGSWDTFRGEHPNLVADDIEITCYSLQERLSRADAEAAAEALALFRSPRDAPAVCDPVFAALAAAGRLAPDETWERIRRLLAANQLREAKRLNALLPRSQAFDDKALDRAAADPSKYLAREKSPLMARSHRELALFALNRLARSKPDEAADRLLLLAPRLGSNASEYAWGQIAWQAALVHHPRALGYYAMAKGAALNDTQIAWKARAGLRAGDWKAVLAAIQALSPEEARDATWRYWRARALRQLGETEAAAGLLKGLARENGFYGLLAAEEVNATVTPDWSVARPSAAELERMRAVPGIERALTLYRIGLDNEALREWIWALRGRDDRSLLAAAELARLANEPDRAINTADRTLALHDFTQRYPTPHREALGAAARQFAVDEAMVYSIIRQESRFMPEARSRVGAMGLMQLMPATARWVAKQIPVQPYSPDMLVQPEVNIQMGAYYFRRVLDDLGHPILATAGYNAGPGRARRWRHERALEGAIYAETIPFAETRDYVKKVFANAWYYRHRLSGQQASMKQLLGMVPGRAADPPGTSVASNLP